MTGSIKLRVTGLTKIFGGAPKRALQHLQEGKDRDWILQQTGNLVAVSDVSFNVQSGEIFVVMGLSGSGKSTLIRCINRLFEPTSGSVLIDDEDVTKANDEQLRRLRLMKVAMVFQHFALFPHKTVIENVEFGLKIRGMATEERHSRAMAVLEQVGLNAWAENYPSSLSGGMQQRVGLARSLAVDPEILLMDEAFSALDPLIRREMQEELLALQRKVRKTIVFITHDLHEALILGNRVAIMKEGRFVQVASPQEIVAHPADDYVTAFTRDVDRSRIFTARDVMTQAPVLRPSDTIATAVRNLKASGKAHCHVIDDEGRVVGLISQEQLIGLGARSSVAKAMMRQFPQTASATELIALYRACADNLPIAVINEVGEFLGSVEPSAIWRRVAVGLEDEH
jgi:glycine betaine/proline transport system ATP-binding protein